VQAAVVRAAQAKMGERASGARPVAAHVQSALAKAAQAITLRGSAIQLSSLDSSSTQKTTGKNKGKKVSLAEFMASTASTTTTKKSPAWENKLNVNNLATITKFEVKSEAEPKMFSSNCTGAEWDNKLIEELVALASKPKMFWMRELKEKNATGETTYWSFKAMWVKSGEGQVTNGVFSGKYVDGTLQLHFHPKAKLTSNYLHIKRTDGSKPTAGEFKKDHWLVKEIGLTENDVTPTPD